MLSLNKVNTNILKKVIPKPEILLKELLSIHVPKEYLEFFELETVLNKAQCWELVLIERENLLPGTQR